MWRRQGLWRAASTTLVIAAAMIAPVARAEAGAPHDLGLLKRAEITKMLIEENVCGSDTAEAPADSSLRGLGRDALPLLAEILRDQSRKRCWRRAAYAVGRLGAMDTTYADTLRAFVWDRHHGWIDTETLRAIQAAQWSIVRLAYYSSRAYNYAIKTARPEEWNTLPWSYRGVHRQELNRDMARISSERLESIKRFYKIRAQARARTLGKTETK